MNPRKEVFKCFVAMKFGEPFDSLFNAGIAPLANVDFGDCNVAFTRADRNLQSLDFLRNVWDNIRSAHFLLADMSPYDTVPFNPNVFYEIGYAKALRKPVVVISHGRTGRPPVNISDCINHVYSLENDDVQAASEHLQSVLTPAINQAISEVKQSSRIQTDSYEVTCHNDRTAARIERVLAAARREINILQTNVGTIRSVYDSAIEKAIRSCRDDIRPLHVRILTLDPDSYFTAFRASQLTKDVGSYRAELHDNLRDVVQRFQEFPEVEVRIYDDFPTQIVFMADDRVFHCTVARRFRSRQLCTFDIDLRQQGVEKSFLFHFESLWSVSRPYLMPKTGGPWSPDRVASGSASGETSNMAAPR